MNVKPLLLLIASTLFYFSSSAQLTIATFNIRFDNPRDTGNLWVQRAPAVAALIRFHQFDVFGTQEGMKHQLDDLIKALPEYTYYGAGRDDGKDKGEFSAVFFKKDKFRLLNKGDFWLSQTPDVPSMGWDAVCCKRICTWVYLQEVKTGRKFYLFNAHFDHQGVEARKESSKLVLKKIKEIAGSNPTIFTGDLNGDHGSEWYGTIVASGFLRDAFKDVTDPYLPNGTFNGFGASLQHKNVIDHIFVTKDITVYRWGALTDTYGGKFPSDHFPVMAEVKLK